VFFGDTVPERIKRQDVLKIWGAMTSLESPSWLCLWRLGFRSEYKKGK